MRNLLLHACLTTAAFVALACATTETTPPRFANATMGIASDFSEHWTIYTDRTTAPESVKDHFPIDKGPDEAPLLLAVRSTGDAYARVWVEPVPQAWTAKQYFSYLYRVFGPQTDVFEVASSDTARAVRWSYRDRNLGTDLVYLETVTVRAGFGIRIGYWTFGSAMSLYREEFEALTDAWRFRDEGGEWKARWAGLTRRLSPQGFESIALTTPGRTSHGCAPGERQLLYEVPGSKGSLYLFGSVHFGEPSNYPFPEAIESAFKRAGSLIVELDTTNLATQREIMHLMQVLGQLPEGEHVRDHLEPGTYRRLEGAFSDLGIPFRSFTNLKPWGLATVLSALKMQSLGYLPRYGVDQYFLERAGGRKILSLETPEEQLQLFDSMDGELFLAFTLLGFETVEQDIEDIMRAWRCGDGDALEALVVNSPSSLLPGAAELIEAIFYDRNERMADYASRRLASPGDHFMVVGAGHVVGDRGIVALLRARGFEVISR